MTTSEKNAAALMVLRANASLPFAERMRLVDEAVNQPSMAKVIENAWAARLQSFADGIK